MKNKKLLMLLGLSTAFAVAGCSCSSKSSKEDIIKPNTDNGNGTITLTDFVETDIYKDAPNIMGDDLAEEIEAEGVVLLKNQKQHFAFN